MGPVSSINLRFLASPSSCATPRKKGYRKTRRSYWAIWYTRMHKPCAYPLRQVSNGHVPSLFISPIVFAGAMSTSPSWSCQGPCPFSPAGGAGRQRFLLRKFPGQLLSQLAIREWNEGQFNSVFAFYHPLPVIQSPCAMMCIWQNIWRIFYIKKNW